MYILYYILYYMAYIYIYIPLPTKVCIVKAMIFPVVTYSYESWTIKKADCQRIEAFELELEKTLESPLDSKEIQPVNLKGSQR